MKYNISDSTSFSMVEVKLNKNDQIKLETGAMVYHTNGITLEGKMNGKSIFSALSKAVVGGENIYKTIATSSKDDQVLALAPKQIGNIIKLEVHDNQQYFLQDGAFLASDVTVDYNSVMQKNLSNSLFGGTGGLFILKTEGVGEILVNAFGDIKEINITSGEDMIIDNNHVLCWETSLNYSIEVASGMFGFKSGEGLVTKFTGNGKVYIQTRQLESFASLIIPFVPRQR